MLIFWVEYVHISLNTGMSQLASQRKIEEQKGIRWEITALSLLIYQYNLSLALTHS